jgi:hypothetical protein
LHFFKTKIIENVVSWPLEINSLKTSLVENIVSLIFWEVFTS